MTNPEYKVPKTCLVKSSIGLTEEQLDQLRRGVTLSDGATRPAEVARARDSGNRTFFGIAITEERNRQVRRTVEALGCKALELVRTAIGPLQIAKLEIGKRRRLTAAEVRELTHSVSGPPPC